jgi:hypothetical protein
VATHEIAEEATATAATMTLSRAMLLLTAGTVALVLVWAVLSWLMAIVRRAATTKERAQTSRSTGRPVLVASWVLLVAAAAATEEWAGHACKTSCTAWRPMVVVVTRVLLTVAAAAEELACKPAKPTRWSLLIAVLVVVAASTA